jgi:hypothetical protein
MRLQAKLRLRRYTCPAPPDTTAANERRLPRPAASVAAHTAEIERHRNAAARWNSFFVSAFLAQLAFHPPEDTPGKDPSDHSQRSSADV